MAWLCPCSLCLKGWGRNRIGGDCLLGQAPKIKGVWATSGITQMQPVVGTFMWSFPLQNSCGRLLISSLCNCNCGNEGSLSLCLAPVVSTGCWCSHGWVCCWALPSSSLEEGKEKLNALRLVLPVWHKRRHYIRAEDIVLTWNCNTGLFCLSSSLLHHGLHRNPSVPLAMSGWDMTCSKKCSETSSQGWNCPKILKAGQASAQSSSPCGCTKGTQKFACASLTGNATCCYEQHCQIRGEM